MLISCGPPAGSTLSPSSLRSAVGVARPGSSGGARGKGVGVALIKARIRRQRGRCWRASKAASALPVNSRFDPRSAAARPEQAVWRGSARPIPDRIRVAGSARP
jgi:hypothetical protein